MSLFLNFYLLGQNVNYKTFYSESDLDRKSNLALELWNYYLSNDLDSLRIVGLELLNNAKLSQHSFAEAVSYRILGDYEIWSGEHDNGRSHLQKGARYFLKIENYLLYSECLISFGNSLFMQGDLDDAQKAYLFALEAGKKSNDQTAWFAAELNLAKVIAAKNDTLRAIELGIHYKNEALRLYRYEAVSNAYGFLYNMVTTDSVLSDEYLEKSIKYARKSKSFNQLSHALNNAAIAQFYDANLDSAQFLFKESLLIRKRVNNHRLICESYLNLAQLYLESNNSSEATLYCDSSVNHALLNGQNLSAIEALILKCDRLESLDGCKQLNRLEKKLDSLESNDTKLLTDVISIFERENREEKELTQFDWSTGLLIIMLVVGLAVLIYRS